MSSQAIPFYKCKKNLHTEECIVKGCQLLICNGPNSQYHLKLQDQEENNLYAYKSDVTLSGKQIIVLDKENPNRYVLVISSMLNKNIINNKNFTNGECLRILLHSQQVTISMEFADLKYIIFNNFEDLKKDHFFKHQEVLDGLSICQICLSDPESVEQATKNFQIQFDETKHI